MTRHLESLAEVASDYDAIVLDQWGVLHNGSAPYGSAIEVLTRLGEQGHRLAVLSNSGKRSKPNMTRITAMGFPDGLFESVMTSGEALWRDLATQRVTQRKFFAVQGATGDAEKWGDGLDIAFVKTLQDAEAVIIMGLPDGSQLEDWQRFLADARDCDLPIFCSNPDRKSPRADGLVISPGALAFAYADLGGSVWFYGKPHKPVFDALAEVLGTNRVLMVGDSMEHDIAGAQTIGWDSLLVRGGIHTSDFETDDIDGAVHRLANRYGCNMPTFSIEVLQ